MKDCNGCKHAEWERTISGKLHPSGEGRCTYKVVVPKLPACMYWLGTKPFIPSGGAINRKEMLKEDCVCFSRG